MPFYYTISWVANTAATGYIVNLVSYIGTAWSETTVTAIGNPAINSWSAPATEGVPAIWLIRAISAAGCIQTQSSTYLDLPNLGWLRQQIRTDLQDDDFAIAGALKYPDSELNLYIREAINDFSKHFPRDAYTIVPTVEKQQWYPLPTDIVLGRVYSVNWQRFINQGPIKDQYYLKRKPYKGGESPPQVLWTWPKLAVGVIRNTPRYYTGHFDVYNNQLYVDIIPQGTEQMVIQYGGLRVVPQQDPDLFDLEPMDLEIISLYVRAKCSSRIDVQDTGLSRWRVREDGSRRDDSPVPTWEMRLWNAYKQKIDEKKLMLPKTGRLTRV